ncbi:MAG: hypothetical protein P8Y64_02120 [Gammaproteobacteria bacterium]
MCFCEADIVNVKIHLSAKRKYPALRYHHEALSRTAREFGFRWSTQVDDLDEATRAQMIEHLMAALPPTARSSDKAA